MQQTVGQKIRYLRHVRGLSQKDLAQGLSSPSMISQIESDRANPSVQLLNRLAERLQTTMNYFFIDQSIQQRNFSGLLLARAYADVGRFSDATLLLDQLDCTLMESSFADEVDYLRALCLLKLGDAGAAQAALEQLLAQERDKLKPALHIQVLLEYGRILCLQRDWNAALVQWRRAVQAGTRIPGEHLPELGQVYEAIGQVYEGREDWENAEHAYRMAQDHYLLGSSLEEVRARKLKQAEQDYHAELYEQAIFDCQACISITTIRQEAAAAAQTTIRRAIALGHTGQINEAMGILNKLKLNREWFEENAAYWYFAVAQVEFCAGNLDAAYELLSKQFPAGETASQLAADAFLLLGSILMKMNRPEEAQAFLLSARCWYEEGHDNSGLINCNKLLSTLYKEMGNYTEALECHDRIHDLMAAHWQDRSWDQQFVHLKEGISK